MPSKQRRTSNTLIPQPEAARKRIGQHQDLLSRQREAHNELRRLVNGDAWTYIRSIALEILTPYHSAPGKTSEEKEKFETYSTLKWGLEALLLKVEQTANNPPPQQKTDA